VASSWFWLLRSENAKYWLHIGVVDLRNKIKLNDFLWKKPI